MMSRSGEKPLLTVIVPIYGVEDYLEECIQSILVQTYRNLEIILVDDGAKGKEPEICDQYEKQDDRISVIHKENGGLVSARKSGLEKATGSYVTFVDGDDWIEPDYYEKMMSHIMENEGLDMVISGFVYDNDVDGCNTYQNPVSSGYYHDELLDRMKREALSKGSFYEPGVAPSVWCKIFKKGILSSAISSVSDNVRMGEDAAIVYPAISASEAIVIDNSIERYHYRIIRNSMSRGYDESYFERIYSLIQGLKKGLASTECMLKGVDYYCLFVLRLGINRFIVFKRGLLHRKEKKYLIKWIKTFDVNTIIGRVDCSLFSKHDYAMLKLLSSEHIAIYSIWYMFSTYYDKMKRRIFR